jgi:hypothetical protein
MDIIFQLLKQPLFRLLGAWMVLILTDIRPVWGIAAFIVWVAWILLPRWISPKKAHADFSVPG